MGNMLKNSKVGFIHITKTGGTNIKDKNLNKELYYGGYHSETAQHYFNKNIPCFAIIRDPIERYKSIFYYNKYGSNKYRKYNNINDINTFIDKHYKNQAYVNKFENGIQFRKQVSWLNNDNAYIILYDKRNLITNIEHFLLNEFLIKFKYDYSGKNINVTNTSKHVPLTKNSIDKINKLYREDVQLYNKFIQYTKNKNKCYCKIKELR